MDDNRVQNLGCLRQLNMGTDWADGLPSAHFFTKQSEEALLQNSCVELIPIVQIVQINGVGQNGAVIRKVVRG